MALSPDTQISPGDHTTVTSVLAGFEAAGFGPTLFATEEGTVRCTACGTSSEPSRIPVEAVRRMEGESDPDDMQAVVAASCPECGKPGTMVLHYGPMASAGDADVLKELSGMEEASAPVSPMEQGTKGVPPVAPA
jgi:endogenous inhibitor of DNA gyrase (YacG/DUF329 family)